MRSIDRRAFRAAARTSRVAGAATTRPSLAEVRDEEHLRTILDERLRPRLRSTWVDAIVAAVRSDILASRRHA
jgi:hypothetical protein